VEDSPTVFYGSVLGPPTLLIFLSSCYPRITTCFPRITTCFPRITTCYPRMTTCFPRITTCYPRMTTCFPRITITRVIVLCIVVEVVINLGPKRKGGGK
jgi:hypothetical protein